MQRTDKYYPSKLLLFGEYGVLLGLKALAVPFTKFSGKFILKNTSSDKTLISLADYLVKNESRLNFPLNITEFKANVQSGLAFESSIPQNYGLGSSGALAAAIFDTFRKDKAEINPSQFNKIILDLAAIESFFHGKSSGIDPFVSLMQKPVLVEGDTIRLPEIQILSDTNSGFFLIDSKTQGKTSGLVMDFLSKLEDKSFSEKFRKAYQTYSNEAVQCLLSSDSGNFFKNMIGLSAFQLESMTELIPSHIRVIFQKGIETKKFAVKICGSGGGGYFLGYYTNRNYIQQVFEQTVLLV